MTQETEEAAAKMDEKKKVRRTQERALNSKRELLTHVRLCQVTPESERMIKGSEISLYCGFLYLMKKLMTDRKERSISYEATPKSPHKIGMTLRPFKKRSRELWTKRLLSVSKYPTIVPYELEKALHLHFDEFRIKRGEERQKGERKNKAGEYFRLPPSELEAFKTTLVKVEKWVLLSVEAQLELEIMRIEAVLLRTQTLTE